MFGWNDMMVNNCRLYILGWTTHWTQPNPTLCHGN